MSRKKSVKGIDRKTDDIAIGRTEQDAPDVDNEVTVHQASRLRAGEFYDVSVADAEEYDLFDILAALAYGITPRTRHTRAEQFDGGPGWLIRLPQPATKVIRAIVKQFENAGTDALEATELWETLFVA